jgi:hypothetical protein
MDWHISYTSPFQRKHLSHILGMNQGPDPRLWCVSFCAWFGERRLTKRTLSSESRNAVQLGTNNQPASVHSSDNMFADDVACGNHLKFHSHLPRNRWHLWISSSVFGKQNLILNFLETNDVYLKAVAMSLALPRNVLLLAQPFPDAMHSTPLARET